MISYCRNCGKPVRSSKPFCSPACKEEYKIPDKPKYACQWCEDHKTLKKLDFFPKRNNSAWELFLHTWKCPVCGRKCAKNYYDSIFKKSTKK